MRKLTIAVTALLLAAIPASWGIAGAGDTNAAAQTKGRASVSVVHGVPGLTVDVYVNDKVTLEDFKPGTVAGPLELPAGNYGIDVRPAGAGPNSDPAISGGVTLLSGRDYSIVAHLAENGDPTLTTYRNSLRSIRAGQARVAVHHTAEAPPVNVRAKQTVLIENLKNPQKRSVTVPADTYSINLAAAGASKTAVGPVHLTFEPRRLYLVYAIGSLADDTFDLVIDHRMLQVRH